MQKKYKKTAWKDLIAKGDDRINQIQLYVRQKYRHIPNLLVFPHFGRGTGTDIIVASNGNKILEVREVTNWQRFAKNGQPIYMNEEKKEQYIKSLTKKVYKLSFGEGQKRFYPTEETKRFMDISHESNLLKGQREEFEANGIEVKIWNRTDHVMGYTTEDEYGNKKYFYWNGRPIILRSNKDEEN